MNEEIIASGKDPAAPAHPGHDPAKPAHQGHDPAAHPHPGGAPAPKPGPGMPGHQGNIVEKVTHNVTEPKS